MPSRIIREGIIDSRAVNALSESGELLYRRLMSIVDDFGRFEFDADLIRARAFPRQLDRWQSKRIIEVMGELRLSNGDSPLITVYHSGSKKYFQMNNFGQRVQSKSKFPAPESPESTVENGDSPPYSKSESYPISKANPKATVVDSPKNGSSESRGRRLDVTELPDSWIEFAELDQNWDLERTKQVFAKFCDYWRSKPGAAGRKTDWLATWRNWCRDERNQPKRNGNGSLFPAKPGFVDDVAVGLQKRIQSGALKLS